jgi:hypothetical protein
VAQTAVVIGDSHVDHSPLASELTRLLIAQGYTVTIAGVGASTAALWLSKNPVCRPKGDWCVDKTALPKNPDLLVVSLGTNDAANMSVSGGRDEPIVAQVKQLASSFNPKKWFWIGPPWMGDKARGYLNSSMARLYNAAAAAGVEIYDSRPVTKPLVEAGSGDGVHLGVQGQKIWAGAIARAIPSLSRSKTAFVVAAVIVVAAASLVIFSRGGR